MRSRLGGADSSRTVSAKSIRHRKTETSAAVPPDRIPDRLQPDASSHCRRAESDSVDGESADWIKNELPRFSGSGTLAIAVETYPARMTMNGKSAAMIGRRLRIGVRVSELSAILAMEPRNNESFRRKTVKTAFWREENISSPSIERDQSAACRHGRRRRNGTVWLRTTELLRSRNLLLHPEVEKQRNAEQQPRYLLPTEQPPEQPPQEEPMTEEEPQDDPGIHT